MNGIVIVMLLGVALGAINLTKSERAWFALAALALLAADVVR